MGGRGSGERAATWARHLAAWRASGLSQAAFCRREGLSLGTLRWRLHESRRSQAQQVGFVEVRPPAGAELPAALEVVLRGGHRVRVTPGFDVATLRQVVAALDGIAC